LVKWDWEEVRCELRASGSTYAADSSEATGDGGDFAGEELGEGHFSVCARCELRAESENLGEKSCQRVDESGEKRWDMRGAAKVGIRWFVVILPRGGGVA
jgi:hypothetical protein